MVKVFRILGRLLDLVTICLSEHRTPAMGETNHMEKICTKFDERS